MATKIYENGYIELIDGTKIYLIPLKIKYHRDFMDVFENVKNSKNDDEAIHYLAECATVCMQQYYPIIQTREDLEDVVDLPTIYKILDIAVGVKINEKSDSSVKNQAVDSGNTWETLDLAKLESEAFLLGIWKDYEELESSLSMPELIATLGIKRELDYSEKRFLAAIQGVNLDEQTEKSNAWEDLKARVFSRGKANDSKDILALQGINAEQAGFGIGLGLDYEEIND